MDLNINNAPGADNQRINDTFVPETNEQQLEQLRFMATLGLRPTAVAQHSSVSTDHLLRVCEHELKDAVNDSNQAVMTNLYEMAVAGKNAAAGLLWLRTKAPDLLPVSLNKTDSQKSPKNKPYVWDPNDPNDRVIFSVYNNDGEPNADY